MGRFLRRRLLAVVPLVILATSMVFSLILLLPGDPAVALVGMEDASEEKLTAIRKRLGLDRPLVVQYVIWLGRVARGDFGDSLRTGQPVIEALVDRAPITLGLALAGTAFGLLVGIPLAVVAADRRGGVIDTLASGLGAFGVAVPNFLLGSMLVLILALQLKWLPATGYVSPFESPGDAVPPPPPAHADPRRLRGGRGDAPAPLVPRRSAPRRLREDGARQGARRGARGGQARAPPRAHSGGARWRASRSRASSAIPSWSSRSSPCPGSGGSTSSPC